MTDFNQYLVIYGRIVHILINKPINDLVKKKNTDLRSTPKVIMVHNIYPFLLD